MEEFVYYNSLFDIYSELLTEKEIATFKDYYQEDLSLSEIAESNNVSRTAVQKIVKNVIDKLNNYEEKLHIYEDRCKIRELLDYEDLNKIKIELEELLGQ